MCNFGGICDLPVVLFHLGCSSWMLWMVCASNLTVVPDYRTVMTHMMLMIAAIRNRNDSDAARFARVLASTKKKQNRTMEMVEETETNIKVQRFCTARVISTEKCTKMDYACGNSISLLPLTVDW